MPDSPRNDGFFGDEDDSKPASEPTDPAFGDFFRSRDFGQDRSDDSKKPNRTGAAVRTRSEPSSSSPGPSEPPPASGTPTRKPPAGRKPVVKIDKQPGGPKRQSSNRPPPPVFEPKQQSVAPAPPIFESKDKTDPVPAPLGNKKRPRTPQPAPPGQAPVKRIATPSEAPAGVPKPTPSQKRRTRSSPSIPDPYADVGNSKVGHDVGLDVSEIPNESPRKAKGRQQALLREQRWARTRLAVPYPTDGPKITFAVIWFAATFGSILYDPIWTGLVTSSVACFAAMQTAQAWFGPSPARWWTATASTVVAASGYFGAIGLAGGTLGAFTILGIYMLVADGHHRTSGPLFDVLIRCSFPAGLAAGGIVALSRSEQLAAVALVLLVSAYEAGDYLVGSGSHIAAEGPIAGFISLSVMAFVLTTVIPEPYTAGTVVAFAAITGIGALAGQIFASAALPRGVAWAPALRRLDSYIIAAPTWLLLVFLIVPS